MLAGFNGAEVGHGVPEDDEFSVEHDAGTKPCQAGQFRELVRHVPVVPRQEPVAVALEESRRPDALLCKYLSKRNLCIIESMADPPFHPASISTLMVIEK